ncbi:MAG: CBS domain-containing protein [Rhodospirillaceae bacterium]|nr:CBS domain-containing protein [Rhodospirillaceae bacterium]
MNRTVMEAIAGRTQVMVDAGESVRETARKILEQGVSAAIIIESGRLMGVFTERDALRFFAEAPYNPDTTNIGAVMTRDPVTVPPETPIPEAKKLMLCKGFRHLPVVDSGRVLGIVSLRGLSRVMTGVTV